MKLLKVQKIIGTLLSLAVLVLAYFLFMDAPFAYQDSKAAALQSISNCLEAERKNSCFQALSHELIEQDKLATVFALIEENQQTPKIFEACHVFLHFVGQAAYKKVGDISETLKLGDYVCFAGFYHGALEGYFIENNLLASAEGGMEALREKVPQICQEDQSALKKDYFECLHGLGHGLMFATDGELPQALELCDALGSQSLASWCYSGAFMENSTSTTNPDHPSKYLKADDLFYPCSILDKKYLNTCYILQSMRVTHEAQGDWPQTASFCMEVPGPYRSACFNGMGQSLIGYSTDPEVTRKNCLAVSSSYQDECIAGAVGGIGERYKPPFSLISNLCSVFAGDSHSQCYQAAIRSMNNWSNDKKELGKFCQTISDGSLTAQCLAAIR